MYFTNVGHVFNVPEITGPTLETCPTAGEFLFWRRCE